MATATGDLRALTLYPEHAELFRLRLRTIETRSKPTRYRGLLLLHAGVRDPDSAVAQRSPRTRAARAAIPHGEPITRGAVVASCRLVDCVPVEALGWSGLEGWSGWHYQAPGGVPVRSISGPDTNPGVKRWPDVPVIAGVEDQRPFGDFSPGRWAWLLEDVKPTTERCPRCWGRGVFDAPWPDGSYAEAWCSTCDGNQSCAPVPMRGRQGLWRPTSEDWARAA